MTSNKKIFNYKVVGRVEGYNFDIKFIFIRVHMKRLWIIFWYRVFRLLCFHQMRLKTKFRDQDDTSEQIWGPKRVIYTFRDRDDTTE